MLQTRCGGRSSNTSAAEMVSCFLCKKNHKNCSSPNKWRNKDAKKYVEALNIPTDAIVCQACRRDIPTALRDPSYTPRWSKVESSANKCSVETCTCTAFSSLQKPSQKIQDALATLFLESTASSTPLPLCKAALSHGI